jgi:hypothetical protein
MLALQLAGRGRVVVDDLWLETPNDVSLSSLLALPHDANSLKNDAVMSTVDAELKFSECLPPRLLASLIRNRTFDRDALKRLSSMKLQTHYYYP